MGVRAWFGRRGSTAPEPAPAQPSTSPVAQRFQLGWQEFPWWKERRDDTTGGRVGREFALSVASVLRARNNIVGTIASQPLRVLDTNNNVVRSPLLEQIDPNVPNSVTLAMTVEDLLFEGIAWWQVLARDATGYPMFARRVDRTVVSPLPPPGTIMTELPSDFIPGSTLWVAGQPTPARDMIRFDSPNPPLLVSGARAIRRAARYEAIADALAEIPPMRGHFEPNESADPTQDEIDDALDDWEARRREHLTGWVPAALKYVPDTSVPIDVQITALIDKATVAIASATGLDSEDLQVSTTSRTYANAVDRRQDKINETYGPLATAITDRLSMGDVTRRGQRVCLSWDRYLQPNPTDRASIASTLVGAKVVTPDEVRMDDFERPPLTDAQREELNPAPPAPPALPAAPDDSTDATQMATVTPIAARASRAAATFAGHPGLIFATDVAGSFQVDTQRRTITGLVMPWDQVGYSDGLAWRFARGSLQYDPAQVSRIKLLIDHNPEMSVGRLERTWSDEVGQWGTFRVARGTAGDNALAMAADGARDGLSVGVGYFGNDVGFSYTDDPVVPGARYVTASPWRETSLVALPAFAGARTTAVNMSAYPNGVRMHCQHCGTVHAPGVACPSVPFQGQQPQPPAFNGQQMVAAGFGQPYPGQPAAPAQGGQPAAPAAPQSAPPAPAGPTYTPEQAAAMFSALLGTQNVPGGVQARPRDDGRQGDGGQSGAASYTPEQLRAMFAAMSAANAGQPDQPANVNPMALPLPGSPAAAQMGANGGQGQGGAQVTREQPLYRFDGNPGQRSFLADISKGFGGDSELREKAGKFVVEQMRHAFANISPANVTDLNPVIPRQDLYVGRLAFTRPIGSQVTGGVVTSLTQSKLPKFNSAAGLAQAHATGTEPTEGSFSTTSQTVTPAPISGKLNIDREVIDQGGSPQADQVMWDAMTQFYAELLETRLVDCLQGLGLTDTPVVGVDKALQTAILNTWAGLQFVRGGDRYTGLALDSTMYTPVITATDDDGRLLFPLDAPQNVAGQAASDLSSVRVGGKVGVPAWALATANGGPAKSYLFVPGSVYQWFMPPERIDLDRIAVSYVGLGIWGYSAEFVSRNSDVMQLAYAAA